jgi:rubrerythrin
MAGSRENFADSESHSLTLVRRLLSQMTMSHTDDEALQNKLDEEKRAMEALMTQYRKVLQDLRTVLQRQGADVQPLSAALDGDAQGCK